MVADKKADERNAYLRATLLATDRHLIGTIADLEVIAMFGEHKELSDLAKRLANELREFRQYIGIYEADMYLQTLVEKQR